MAGEGVYRAERVRFNQFLAPSYERRALWGADLTLSTLSLEKLELAEPLRSDWGLVSSMKLPEPPRPT